MKTTIADGAARHYSAEAYARRKAAEKAAQDIMGETFDIENMTAASFALLTGRLYLTKVGVAAGDPITKMMVRCNTALSAGTLLKFGLFSVVGNGSVMNATCLVASTDQTANFASAAPKNVPLVYTPPEDDMLFAGALFTGTTGPSLYTRMSSSLSANAPADGHTGQPRSFAYSLGGQTDIATGQVFSTVLADGNSIQFYAALRA
jgi:hypothetical protein